LGGSTPPGAHRVTVPFFRQAEGKGPLHACPTAYDLQALRTAFRSVTGSSCGGSSSSGASPPRSDRFGTLGSLPGEAN